jgi:hypothetical protein
MLTRDFLFALSAAAGLAHAAGDLPDLSTFLTDTSSSVFPPLKDIAVEVYHDPELGRDEQHAHDLVVEYFSNVDGWDVTPHAFDMPTAWRLVFENRPDGFDGQLPTVGFMSEYDALVGIGHACGHNHILLNGVTAASLASKALVEYDLPGRIIVMGCPDEENAAGKFNLSIAGAFDDVDVWLMAHPTSTSAIQPMNSRLNTFFHFVGETHQEAVRKAYEAMVIIRGLTGTLPGTASTVSNIENVGVYAVNIVQSIVTLGVSGSTREHVDQTVSSLLDDTYPGVNYSLFEDADGVGINITGPGGHASEATKGPLVLSIETFRTLSSENDASISFYLPGNTTSTVLDITADMRTRYTSDIPALAQAVSDAVGSLAASTSSDLKYPSLEVLPWFPENFLSILTSPDYGLDDFIVTDFAPASTDASWVQSPVLDPVTHEVLSAKRAVFHPNYSICGPNEGDPCAFNHEPAFAEVAGTEFSYTQTEIMARAEAQLAVELIADEEKMREASAIVH